MLGYFNRCYKNSTGGGRKIKHSCFLLCVGINIWDYLCHLAAMHHYLLLFIPLLYCDVPLLCCVWRPHVCDGRNLRLWGEKERWMAGGVDEEVQWEEQWKKVGQECRFWTRWLWATVQPHMFLHGVVEEALCLSHAVPPELPCLDWHFNAWWCTYPLPPITH